MGTKYVKKLTEKILRLGSLFFVLFFTGSALFIPSSVLAVAIDGKCGPASGNTYNDYHGLVDAGQCDPGTSFNVREEDDGEKTKWIWDCAGEDGGKTTTDCYAFTEAVLKICGDGTVDDGEECDDGNTDSGDGCSSDCKTEGTGKYCGDGNVDTTEECDDGNIISGDGCSSVCELEKGIIKYDNPLSTDNIIDIVQRIADYFYYIAIALVPIIVIYASILFLTAGGDEQQVAKARKTFIYLIIGVAVLLIGSGFITLIKDILNVK